MTTIPEGRQYLDFDASWVAFKWDKAEEFVGSMDRALHQLSGEGVKAADVVGVKSRGSSGSAILLVAEFKDFAHPAMPAKDAANAVLQAESDKLRQDVVRKVIDTLAWTKRCGARDQQCHAVFGVWDLLSRVSLELSQRLEQTLGAAAVSAACGVSPSGRRLESRRQ